MHGLLIYLCLLTSLFYFSEGKPCPEKSRRHKTRCDAYYKCRDLPSNSHVWIPTKCKEGLVYEHSVGSCVLPAEDWECLTPNELNNATNKLSVMGSKDADIIIVNSDDESGILLKESPQSHDDNVEIVLDAFLSSEEQSAQPFKPAHESTEYESSSSNTFDSSGDGELVDLDSQVQLENREGVANISYPASAVDPEPMTLNKHPSSSIDPTLKAHLQRLSQLIDGLQQTYQKTDKPQTEMRPDQLNAFLAHFDLKTRYDMFNPLGEIHHTETATTAPPTTHTTPMTPMTPTRPMEVSAAPTLPLPKPTANKTRLQEHLTKHRMQPETKLMLTNAQPFTSNGQGYTNSQIVVNRPEGSVTFTLPQYGSSEEHSQKYAQPQSHEYMGDQEPKVSEETLKTVLELSKQMISAQNMPKVIPNPAYNGAFFAQPILQPIILTTHNNPFQQYFSMQDYESHSPPRSHYVHHKKPSGYNKKQSQPSTTIIHNNVIPVHLASTSSGEKEVLDTYGNSLGVYPSSNNKNNQNQMESNNYLNKFMAIMTTPRPNSSSSSSSISGMSVTTMSSQYTGQYAAPYAGEFVQTTPRPFEHQPSASTVSSYYTPSPHLNENNAHRVFNAESYPTSMSIDLNVPRPMDSHNLFPIHLKPDQVKIRPNSQKIESMEVEADEASNINYVNSHANANHLHTNNYNSNNYNNQYNNNQNNNRQNGPHVLTYSSGDSADLIGMNNQLAPGSYVDQRYAMNEQHRPDYSPAYLPNLPASMSSVYNEPVGNSMYPSPMSSANNIQVLPGKTKYQSALNQLVNFNGNFISLDLFQKSILPLMTQSPSALSNLGKVEVITCQAGVRQPNQTDCTRYFVCSKKDGKVLSYSCPPYTGFNKQTRICDAVTYAQCGTVQVLNGYSIEENKRLQIEALKMLSEAKRRQEATLKSQSIASLLQQYSSMQEPSGPAVSSSMEHSPLDSYMISLPELTTTPRPTSVILTLPAISSSSSNSNGNVNINTNSNTNSNNNSNSNSNNNSNSNSSGSVKKRKYYCREGDKIPDQTSISSYFVCYKTAQGQMKGHKMTCSKGLLFCPRTLMCTLASKCSG
ncbi:putative uncharacterized protein DDB_G0282129 [Drosophila navojoa]|uniref:putative uncharacterized protein DDB_G0282129 n=1 Tax=Drosophila navojoa TaxID=7232 RepID=UPI0011BF190E|nr:putative uncharacterized protein DDB_G0282129 [Drosophila navojoa]